jgi:hypothetical protein
VSVERREFTSIVETYIVLFNYSGGCSLASHNAQTPEPGIQIWVAGAVSEPSAEGTPRLVVGKLDDFKLRSDGRCGLSWLGVLLIRVRDQFGRNRQ